MSLFTMARCAVVAVAILVPSAAFADDEPRCPAGFTKFSEQSGAAACRRTAIVADAGLADALSKLWFDGARCAGGETDRQSGVAQNPDGDWTVSLRFWCNQN